ncbi:MAG: hypothetical protein OXI27_05630 [Thaumarchaeota archaeon]|nr:hypothetical protein [Nitrososphaerota archaeon]
MTATVTGIMTVLCMLAISVPVSDAFAEEIKIVHLNGDSFIHTGTFDYSVSAFNAEQDALGSNYSINSVRVDVTSSTVEGEVQRLYGLGYKYFVGPTTSESAKRVLGYINAPERSDIVMIAPISAATSLAMPNDGLFRMISDNAAYVPIIVDNINDHGKEGVVILYRNDEWGRDQSGSLSDSYAGNSVAISLDDGTAVSQTVDGVRQLVSAHGADNVAVVLVAFESDVVSLVKSILANAEWTAVLNDVQWYGTGGFTLGRTLVDDAEVAEFLASVNISAFALTVPENPVNAELARQNFPNPEIFRNSVYDAVFLLADAVIVSANNPGSTVRGQMLNVANGLETHSFHGPDRMTGAGALGDYSLNAAGDLAAGESDGHTLYTIRATTDGGFGWGTFATRTCR